MYVDIKLGDCIKLMNEIEDTSIDLILCDLPFQKTKNKWDKIIPFDKLWENYKRIIKENGAIILFCQGSFYIDLVNSNREDFRYDLVWDKNMTTGFLNCNRQPLRKHEQIAVFYKKQPTYNPIFSEGQPLHGKGKNYKTSSIKNNNYGKFNMLDDYRKGNTQKYPTSIITIQKVHPSKTIHPTEKPVELMKYLIETYTKPGETILDNCMGSGTVGIACLNSNRNFIGIEINENYYKLASNRIYKEIVNGGMCR
ncbi:MAG: site-specific DNA-methyltransferase [Clostridiales bacterium]|nr:site-specific DNA-methyltransferase [Clostridiales bacterium]